jgi:hypothetical protein
MLASSFSVLLPVLFVIALGYWAGRAKQFDIDQVQGINGLVVDYALPALMFVGIATTTSSVLFAELPFLFVLFVGFAGFYVLALLFSLHILRHSLGAAALQACSVSFPSVAFMGIPIFEGLFGKSTLLSVSCANALGILIVVPVTVVLLEVHKQHSNQEAIEPEGKCPEASLSSTRIVGVALIGSLKKPVVWVPLLAFALVLAGIRVPDEIDAMVKLIGQTTSGVALFASGLVLAAYQLKVNREVIGNVVAKMIAQPICIAILVSLLAVESPLGREAILIGALPTAVFPTLLAPRYGVYVSECASTLILTTLAMVVVLPLAIVLTGG